LLAISRCFSVAIDPNPRLPLCSASIARLLVCDPVLRLSLTDVVKKPAASSLIANYNEHASASATGSASPTWVCRVSSSHATDG
jgi:hypothetical protein